MSTLGVVTFLGFLGGVSLCILDGLSNPLPLFGVSSLLPAALKTNISSEILGGADDGGSVPFGGVRVIFFDAANACSSFCSSFSPALLYALAARLGTAKAVVV